MYNVDAQNDSDNDHFHGIAFAELVAFMEEHRREEGIAPIFKLTDLALMYKARLEQLSVVVGSLIHTFRLKTRLMSVFPDLRAHSQGKSIVIAFDDDVGGALNYDGNAIHLARAAEVVRKEIFEMKCSFVGSFDQTSERDVVPPPLMALIRMIVDGPSIKCLSDVSACTRAALPISQLLIFNSVKNNRRTHLARHKHDRETPLPLCVALKIYATTWKRT